MSLRRFLLLPLLISLVAFGYYSSAVHKSFDTVSRTVHITGHLVIVLLLATALQLLGHVIRAHKARLLLRPVKESSTRFQFRALSIGYLFNTILPFRLGELVRARVIAGAMTISFSLAIVFIIFERALDALILGVIGLALLPIISNDIQPRLTYYVLFLIVLALVIFGFLWLLTKQNKYLLKIWYNITKLLNDNLKHSFRFKVWSIIYGLQQSLTPQKLIRYIGLSLASWALYGASILVLAQYLFGHLSLGDKTILAAAPYYGVAIPSGPANLGVFSHATNAVTAFLGLSNTQTLSFNLLSWAVLVLPIATAGLLLLLVKTKETFWETRPKQASMISLSNKLHRSEDISYEMASFLENYFSGNSLSRIVHKLELRDNFRLLKYFKGGSDAITILALQDNQRIVKKIIPLEFEDRLRAQYDWLAERRDKEGIVNVLRQEKTADYYAIDLAFCEDDALFFDYIHRNPLKDSQVVLEDVWKYLFKQVHTKLDEPTLHPKQRIAYINRHIYGCFDKAALVEPELLVAAEQPVITINGKTYDNLFQILDKIKAHPTAWRDIATYAESGVVHGDVIVDNLLVNAKSGKPLLIDPAPDGNIINGPVFDFGKNLQSFYCGYEFSLRDEDPVYLINNAINYDEHASVQYTKLNDYVVQKLAPKYLSPEEQKAMLFHAAALHIRRLKHQVYYTPANVLKFYAIGVKTLNDFLAQYD